MKFADNKASCRYLIHDRDVNFHGFDFILETFCAPDGPSKPVLTVLFKLLCLSIQFLTLVRPQKAKSIIISFAEVGMYLGVTNSCITRSIGGSCEKPDVDFILNTL
jgi:hypothetical protein